MWQHRDMHSFLKKSGTYKEDDYVGPMRAMGGGAQSTTTLRRPISTQGPERPQVAASRLRPDLHGELSIKHNLEDEEANKSFVLPHCLSESFFFL
jgi:hypothetical protein